MVLEIERGSTRSHFLKNSLWKRLWICRKTDYMLMIMMMIMMMMMMIFYIFMTIVGFPSRVIFL
jgi:hypothetical protein